MVLGFHFQKSISSFIIPHLRANSLYNLNSIIMTVVIIHHSQGAISQLYVLLFTCDMRAIQIVDDNYVDFQQLANQ